MRNDDEIQNMLSEIKRKRLRMSRDELLEEFSCGFSEKGRNRLTNLTPYVESSRRGIMKSFITMQAVGRVDGWMDALLWMMEESSDSQ